MATFEIVALVLEEPARIIYFLEHYIRRGATRLTIYFDGTQRLPFEFTGSPVEVIYCDDGFWDGQGLARPSSVEARQRFVYAHAYRRSTTDWLLVIDADEFVFGDTAIGRALDRLPQHVRSTRVTAAEAVFGRRDDIDRDFGTSYFRVCQGRYMAQVLPRLLYPGLGAFFIRGMLGHSIGKLFIRTGMAGVEIDIHRIFIGGEECVTVPISDLLPGVKMHLGHFDAISYSQWRTKWDRRLEQRDAAEMGSKRERQMRLYARTKARGERRLRRLFRRLYALEPWQFWLLSRFGVAIGRELWETCELERPRTIA